MPEKILIVDDDIDSLKLIGLMLQRQGYEILAANGGAQALTKASAERPNLIILDVMMPDMDGIELCRRIRAHPHTGPVPVIFLSARNDAETVERGLAAGANAYLTKSELVEGLLPKISALLQPQPATVDHTLLACVGV